MTIEINYFEAIYPAVLRRFKLETTIIEKAYNAGFDRESNKKLNDLDDLIDDIITGKINTDILTAEQLNELIVKTEYEYRLTHRINDFLSYFTINALYSSYELYLKDVVLLPQKMDSKDLKRLSYTNNLIFFLKEKYGIEYSKLSYFSSIDELRCLNNSIKHGRVVNAELNAIRPDKWHLGKEIENVFDDFKRLKDASYDILEYLTKEIKIICESKPS